MKRQLRLTSLCVLMFLAVAVIESTACTSFAVYGDRPLYGMNFDYPPNEIRFSIEQHPVGSVFMGSFWMGNSYGRTVGMNVHGLFSSDQMISPLRTASVASGGSQMYIWNSFYEGLSRCTSVPDILDMIGDRRLVQFPTPALHNLFADPTGDAMVVESGVRENVITRIQGSFLIMTNFHNGDFADSPIESIVGGGADRYRIAYRMIEDNVALLSIDDAFEVLECTAQVSGSYQTRWSLVADPEALEIYIALERDYTHIWKVSLQDQTIETANGFSTHHVLPLYGNGVTGSMLRALARQFTEGPNARP